VSGTLKSRAPVDDPIKRNSGWMPPGAQIACRQRHKKAI
jgi:hypothetical protein